MFASLDQGLPSSGDPVIKDPVSSSKPGLSLVQLAAIESVDGWLSPAATEISHVLLDYQYEVGTVGGVLELGVYKGKYLSVLAALTASTPTPVVGVDAFLARVGEPLEDRWRDHAIEEIYRVIDEIAGSTHRLIILSQYTQTVDPVSLLGHSPHGFRFVSVDASHEADDVCHDLRLARSVLAEGGVVALDDAFNPATPGVSEGLCTYFLKDDTPELAPFAIGGGKLFLADPAWREDLYVACKSALRNGNSDLMMRSRVHAEENDNIGFLPRFMGQAVVIFRTDE